MSKVKKIKLISKYANIEIDNIVFIKMKNEIVEGNELRVLHIKTKDKDRRFALNISNVKEIVFRE